VTGEPSSGAERLKRAVDGLVAARREAGNEARQKLEPCCPFDAYLEERIKKLEDEVKEARGRNSSLLMLVAGVVVTQIILRVMGV